MPDHRPRYEGTTADFVLQGARTKEVGYNTTTYFVDQTELVEFWLVLEYRNTPDGHTVTQIHGEAIEDYEQACRLADSLAKRNKTEALLRG